MLQLFCQPIELTLCGGTDCAVGSERGFLARVFVLQFQFNLSADGPVFIEFQGIEHEADQDGGASVVWWGETQLGKGLKASRASE